MFKYFFFLIFFFACTSLPVEKELLFKGEPLNEIGPYGVLVGHTMVPIGDFPYDRRSAVVYFENVKTKQEYYYGETRGPFYMKLPPGEYAVKDIWSDGKCNPTTGLMISTFFSELPSSVSHLKRAIEKPAGSTLGFKIAHGRMTDIGNILMSCFEWNGNDKFKNQFTSFIRDGKFQLYMPVNVASQECGCKILRKKDGVSLREYKKAVGKN